MAKRPRVRSNFPTEHVFRARPPGASPPFFLSFFLSFFLPVPSRRGTSLRNRGATGPSLPCWRTIASRCSIDPLDRAREEVAVGNLFILISVRHKLPTRGEEWRKSKASTAKRAVLLCQLLGDPRVYAINVICTPAWNFKRYS